jgi:hypothetical protein
MSNADPQNTTIPTVVRRSVWRARVYTATMTAIPTGDQPLTSSITVTAPIRVTTSTGTGQVRRKTSAQTTTASSAITGQVCSV